MKMMISIVLLILPVFVFPKTLVYEEKTGADTIVDTYRIEPLESGYEIRLSSLFNGKPKWDVDWQTDADFNTLKWSFRCKSEGSDIRAVRTGNKIALEGVFKSRDVRKEYSLNSRPWKQHFPFGLDRDLFGKSEFSFWGIGLQGQGELEAGEMQVKVDSKMTIDIDGNQVPANHARISLTGWLEPFWHADVYFRENDGRYLRLEAVNGGLGAPLTTVTFKSEEE
jgi:hypothetical protein